MRGKPEPGQVPERPPPPVGGVKPCDYWCEQASIEGRPNDPCYRWCDRLRDKPSGKRSTHHPTISDGLPHPRGPWTRAEIEAATGAVLDNMAWHYRLKRHVARTVRYGVEFSNPESDASLRQRVLILTDWVQPETEPPIQRALDEALGKSTLITPKMSIPMPPGAAAPKGSDSYAPEQTASNVGPYTEYDHYLRMTADAQRYKLRLNSHKGWIGSVPLSELLRLLRREVDELEDAINRGSEVEMLLETADAMNFAMGCFIAAVERMNKKERPNDV